MYLYMHMMQGPKSCEHGQYRMAQRNIFDHLSTKAEKLSSAYRALAVAEH